MLVVSCEGINNVKFAWVTRDFFLSHLQFIRYFYLHNIMTFLRFEFLPLSFQMDYCISSYLPSIVVLIFPILKPVFLCLCCKNMFQGSLYNWKVLPQGVIAIYKKNFHVNTWTLSCTIFTFPWCFKSFFFSCLLRYIMSFVLKWKIK